ncbi:unnamed protein product [Effrenium voratum]|nr:unnamed protein product [Effrenium voratum]
MFFKLPQKIALPRDTLIFKERLHFQILPSAFAHGFCGYQAEERPKRAPAELQTFQLTKSVVLRLLGFIYLVAFKVALDQNPGLIGENGLTPVAQVFEQKKREVSALEGFLTAPSLFWFVPLNDDTLQLVAWLGLACGLALVCGVFSSLICGALWLLYFSIVTSASGTAWYAYGWESQLLETGFLAIFLCSPFSLSSEPSLGVLWLLRWLSFRISVGAGLIKVRGSSCWTDRTCLWYHFETQPNPSPLAFLWHFLPKDALSRGVDLDIFVQLYAVWLVLIPGFGPLRHLRRLGGLVQAIFMLNIAVSGNLSFLNHLTIIPAIACLDDACLRSFLKPLGLRLGLAKPRAAHGISFVRVLVDVALVLTIAYLSLPVAKNLLQMEGRQKMNSSFGAFRLVNTYGAFGNVGQERYEAIVSVSHDRKKWVELEFPCKPGRVDRRPCTCAPYHYRLDWNIWFLGFKPHQAYLQNRETWMWAFLAKILDGDAGTIGLLAPEVATGLAYFPEGPQGERRNPKFVKVDMWRYRMRAPLWEILQDYWQNGTAIWWERSKGEALVPALERNYTVLARMLELTAVQ